MLAQVIPMDDKDVIRISSSDDGLEYGEIVVTAKVLPIFNLGGGSIVGNAVFDIFDFRYGVHYGPGTDFDPEQEVKPGDIIAPILKGLGVAIEAAVKAAGVLLSPHEASRLMALAETLDIMSDGVKAGNISNETAKATLTTSLAFTLDGLAGFGTSLALTSIGGFIVAQSGGALGPLGSAGLVVGLGAVGLAFDYYLNQSGAVDASAKFIIDKLFEGTAALAEGLNEIYSNLREGLGAFG